MILVIDIGNTHIKFALVSESLAVAKSIKFNTKDILRFTLLAGEDIKNIEVAIKDLCEKKDCNGIILSSVVPDAADVVASMVKKVFGLNPFIINSNVIDSLSIKIEASAKDQIGNDLLCDAVGAAILYNTPNITIDFGTALSFVAISKGVGDYSTAEIAGVAIAPGVITAMKSLAGETAALMEIKLVRPKSTLGIDTTTALQAGLVEGYRGLIFHMIERIKSDLVLSGKAKSIDEIKTIATGGTSNILEALDLEGAFDFIDTDLTIKGAFLIAKKVLEIK